MATNHVIVTLNAEQCRALSNIVGEYCRPLSKDWQKWGNFIQQEFQSAIDNASQSGSSQGVDVSLSEQNWRGIIDAINRVCQKRGKEWSNWASQITTHISETLEPKQDPDLGPPPPIEEASPAQSKVDVLCDKGWFSYVDAMQEADPAKRSQHLTKANGYLTMAYSEAGNNIEEKKGIAGLMAIVLVAAEDYKNAEEWARKEFKINPDYVFAKLAWYWIELNRLIGHKGFVTQADGTWGGLFGNLLTGGIDSARFQGKKNTVHAAAVDAAKAIEKHVRNDPEPNPGKWIVWSFMLLSIIDNMWANNMKEPYLCKVLLDLPWNRFTKEVLKDIKDDIEEIEVSANGFMSRLR